MVAGWELPLQDTLGECRTMRSPGLAVALTAAALSLAGCAQNPTPTVGARTVSAPEATKTVAEERVSGAELASMFSGDTRWAWRNERAQGIAEYRQDGTASARWSNAGGQRRTAEGTWRLAGDAMCATWAEVRDGEETCFHYVPGEGGYRVIHASSGQVEMEARRIR
ncbi:hypothetical protein GCM10009099_17040 [Caenispirillum bisanense]